MSEETENLGVGSALGSDELPVADFSTIMGLNAEDHRWVEVPEWNARVKIKSLTKAEQIKLRKKSSKAGVVDDILLEINLIADSLVEPRLSAHQVDELFAKANARALNRIAAASLAFSGLTEDYIGEAERDFRG